MSHFKIKELTVTSVFLFATILAHSFFTPDKPSKKVTDKISEIIQEERPQKETNDSIIPINTTIDVPFENQNGGDIPLGNGCEITSLSMLLQYYGYDVNKNQLADILDYVPLEIDEEEDEDVWYYGNPHDGFVGDIYGGFDAMGVAVEPIEKVAKEIVGNKNIVQANADMPFSEIEEEIKKGNPVFVISTIDYAVPTEDDWLEWETTSGTIIVTPLCHAGVITGIDEDIVFVNDPLGEKNRGIPKEQFIEAFQAMGSQGLYLK